MKQVLVLIVLGCTALATASEPKALPALPEGVTSFGAVTVGDDIFAYGGHSGMAHHYSTAHHSYHFSRLNLTSDKKWQELEFDVPVQGFGFATHGGYIYRLGGSQAQNAPDEDEQLISLDSVARFDTRTGKWQACTPLPEARSSFNAAVVGDHVYVAGGWLMPTEGDHTWLDTAWRADLRKWPLVWEALPKLPKTRRAHAAVSVAGHLVLMGGMGSDHKTSNQVTIFDPSKNAWRDGADYPGEGRMNGFGVAACVVGQHVFASGYDGHVHRYDSQSDRWSKTEMKLSKPRFFHCLVAHEGKVISLGGATKAGHSDTAEVVGTIGLAAGAK